jgi:CheY-like chemotaxis protein
MMDGHMLLESVYGQGTKFKVEIPKVIGDEKQLRRLDSSENIIYAPDAKILVVDDNTINLNVICGLLRLFRIKAETAASGKEAIELVRKNRYDLVFMDHMMPIMDGVQATKIIRTMEIDVPIVALTANVVTGVRDQLLAAGMNDFLSKPIIKSSLINVLKKMLPREKIQVPPAILDDPDQKITLKTAGFWDKIDEIDGLSLQTGLDMVSGQRSVYEKSLKLLVKEIEKCIKNLNNFLVSNDLKNFAIEVHSIKLFAEQGQVQGTEIGIRLVRRGFKFLRFGGKFQRSYICERAFHAVNFNGEIFQIIRNKKII